MYINTNSVCRFTYAALAAVLCTHYTQSNTRAGENSVRALKWGHTRTTNQDPNLNYSIS